MQERTVHHKQDRRTVTKAPRLNSAKSTDISLGSAAHYIINNWAKPNWIAFSYCL